MHILTPAFTCPPPPSLPTVGAELQGQSKTLVLLTAVSNSEGGGEGNEREERDKSLAYCRPQMKEETEDAGAGINIYLQSGYGRGGL